jgi:hypothetical protein
MAVSRVPGMGYETPLIDDRGEETDSFSGTSVRHHTFTPFECIHITLSDVWQQTNVRNAIELVNDDVLAVSSLAYIEFNTRIDNARWWSYE